jgi:hypothetical protein
MGTHPFLHRLLETDIQLYPKQNKLSIQRTHLTRWWDIYDRVAINEHIDVMDQWGVWYEAVVMERDNERGVFIHYIGWKHSWDEWFPRQQRFHFAPLHTFTPRWRDGIQIGQVVEHRANHMWYETICIEKKDKSVWLERVLDNQIIHITDIYQEKDICPMGFHIHYCMKDRDPTQKYRKKYSIYNLSLFPQNGNDTLFIVMNLLEKRAYLQEHI